MERLYTPWRMQYVTGTQKKKMEGCVFCAMRQDSPDVDSKNFVVYRGKTTFTIMNIYPYNTGHLMILPNEHLATLSQMSSSAHLEMMSLTAYFVDLLTELMHPDGFNAGLNLGGVAGAGIDSHLHMHIVPRWGGDSNFMTVIGQTRVLPETISDTYQRIVAVLQKKPPVFSE